MNTTALSVTGRQKFGEPWFSMYLGLFPAAVTFYGWEYPKYINNDVNAKVSWVLTRKKNENTFVTEFTAVPMVVII